MQAKGDGMEKEKPLRQEREPKRKIIFAPYEGSLAVKPSFLGQKKKGQEETQETKVRGVIPRRSISRRRRKKKNVACQYPWVGGPGGKYKKEEP